MFRPETIHVDTWPAIYALLAPAIAYSDSTPAQVIDDLISGETQLWVSRSKGGDPIAAAVSELEDTPRGQFVHGMLLGGNRMADWIDDLIFAVTVHGIERGAVGIKINGREGWARVLGNKGWKRRSIAMETEFAKEPAHG